MRTEMVYAVLFVMNCFQDCYGTHLDSLLDPVSAEPDQIFRREQFLTVIYFQQVLTKGQVFAHGSSNLFHPASNSYRATPLPSSGHALLPPRPSLVFCDKDPCGRLVPAPCVLFGFFGSIHLRECWTVDATSHQPSNTSAIMLIEPEPDLLPACSSREEEPVLLGVFFLINVYIGEC